MPTGCARSTSGRPWSGTHPPDCSPTWCATPPGRRDAATLRQLVEEGLLTEAAEDGGAVDIAYFTTLYRQTRVFEHMRAAVREYLDMWYGEWEHAGHIE